MHLIHSFEVKETDDGKHAIIIKFGGVLNDDFERDVMRSIFDMTLRRERTGGVVLDLGGVYELTGASRARIRNFADLLFEDGIQLVIVAPKNEGLAMKLLEMPLEINMVPMLKIAKEILGITE